MTRVSLIPRTTLAVAFGLATSVAARAQETPPPPLLGRWDLVVSDSGGTYPSWLEVTRSGYNALVGRFVGQSGSARPIGNVAYDNGAFSFAIPPQWEQGKADLRLDRPEALHRLDGPHDVVVRVDDALRRPGRA